MHQSDDLIELFNITFMAYQTRLVRGDDEPFYQAARSVDDCHQVIFAHGFYASALHEIAHWCIAGPKRRLMDDYGYWYEPDGRSAEQQQEFEKVEIKPQALEWAFSLAANFKFRVSVDNLGSDAGDWRLFQHHVGQQLRCYQQQGFPKRAQLFIDALTQFYTTHGAIEQVLKAI
ncbi:elongation factor P hydroxylase [Celerinatantimonas yamalensis]|uniref:Elongation factor P hydroxylase n=1 Tax=Celerinatantimonas yamalensis TaxID=559956 RepID=A0ABW9G2G1_9GAMM